MIFDTRDGVVGMTKGKMHNDASISKCHEGFVSLWKKYIYYHQTIFNHLCFDFNYFLTVYVLVLRI